MPELDTYNTIKRYAEANNDPATVLSYVMLRTRAERVAMWRAVSLSFGDLEAALDLTLGRTGEKRPGNLADMSEEERKKLYDAACKAAGIKIDPAALTK